MPSQKIKYYLKGTLVIILIFGLILVSCYGVATNSSENVRKIFYICFGSVLGATIIAYWIYGYVRELKLAKREENNQQNPYQNNNKKKK
ncbi:MAG: hypothetical protein LKJ88_03850 [Bacilli bacterium]|jgi:phosphate/sulfate permease|nr:hypothetical protein [Bacilli bacterium]